MATTTKKTAAKGAKSTRKKTGRPPNKVFVNISVRETTRAAMKKMCARDGITQGEFLDRLISQALKRR